MHADPRTAERARSLARLRGMVAEPDAAVLDALAAPETRVIGHDGGPYQQLPHEPHHPDIVVVKISRDGEGLAHVDLHPVSVGSVEESAAVGDDLMFAVHRERVPGHAESDAEQVRIQGFGNEIISRSLRFLPRDENDVTVTAARPRRLTAAATEHDDLPLRFDAGAMIYRTAFDRAMRAYARILGATDAAAVADGWVETGNVDAVRRDVITPITEIALLMRAAINRSPTIDAAEPMSAEDAGWYLDRAEELIAARGLLGKLTPAANAAAETDIRAFLAREWIARRPASAEAQAAAPAPAPQSLFDGLLKRWFSPTTYAALTATLVPLLEEAILKPLLAGHPLSGIGTAYLLAVVSVAIVHVVTDALFSTPENVPTARQAARRLVDRLFGGSLVFAAYVAAISYFGTPAAGLVAAVAVHVVWNTIAVLTGAVAPLSMAGARDRRIAEEPTAPVRPPERGPAAHGSPHGSRAAAAEQINALLPVESLDELGSLNSLDGRLDALERMVEARRVRLPAASEINESQIRFEVQSAAFEGLERSEIAPAAQVAVAVDGTMNVDRVVQRLLEPETGERPSEIAFFLSGEPGLDAKLSAALAARDTTGVTIRIHSSGRLFDGSAEERTYRLRLAEVDRLIREDRGLVGFRPGQVITPAGAALDRTGLDARDSALANAVFLVLDSLGAVQVTSQQLNRLDRLVRTIAEQA
ncbi:MAG: hypothetical protein JO102_00285, partial [Elusimicrobia bacterium]|nr:hypothetical protein [Elusimicrobiota bacterium]